MEKYIKLDSSKVLILNKNKYLIQVSFKKGFFVLELSLETVFKYVKDSQEDFKWPKVFLMQEIAGQSLRSGGATSLAEAGADLATIQAAGRWASKAFQIYIRKHPVLLHAMIFGRPAHQPLD